MSKCKGDPEEEDNREAEEGGGQWRGESLWWDNSLVFFAGPNSFDIDIENIQ